MQLEKMELPDRREKLITHMLQKGIKAGTGMYFRIPVRSMDHVWKLKQIFDGEHGHKRQNARKKKKCLVILANEEGEEKTFEANEDWIAAIEKLSANPLMKIIISKPMAKDCQSTKDRGGEERRWLSGGKVYRETGVSR